jgi:hypothetical protein
MKGGLRPGSSCCAAIESEKQYTAQNGLNYLEFYLIMSREDRPIKTKGLWTVGPMYVVYISGVKLPLALIILSKYGKSDSRFIKPLLPLYI